MAEVALALINSVLLPPELKAAVHSIDWLTDSERQKLTQLLAPRRRLQFLVGHGLVRQLLAAQYGGDPWHDWPLDAPTNGPPCLLSQTRQSGLKVALSHSAAWVAAAVSNSALGLDVETPNERRSLQTMLGSIGTREEQVTFNAIAPSDQAREFYRIWTLKEAWLKQRHEGLALGRLPLLQTRPARESDPLTARVWHFRGLTMSCLAPAEAKPIWWNAPSGLEESELPQQWAVDELPVAYGSDDLHIP